MMGFDMPEPPAVKIAMIRVEHEQNRNWFLRCPVKMIFRGVSGLPTYVVEVPEDEVERLNEEVEEWLAKKEFG